MPERFAKLFILVIMGNGLIANYAPQLGVNMGTLCIDGLVLALAAGAILKECLGKSGGKSVIPFGQKDVFVIFIFVAVLTLASYLAVGAYSPGLTSDLRIRFLYFLVAPALFVLLSPASARRVLRFFVSCGAVFCLFAIAQSIFASQLLMLDKSRGTYRALKFVPLAVVLTVGVFSLFGDSVLFARFLGEGAFTQASNDSHFGNIANTLSVIVTNPLFGTGLETQIVSESSALADGRRLQLAAETGVVIFCLCIFVHLHIGSFLVKRFKNCDGFPKAAAAVCVVALCYFMTDSVINPSFIERADLTLFFVLLGEVLICAALILCRIAQCAQSRPSFTIGRGAVA